MKLRKIFCFLKEKGAIGVFLYMKSFCRLHGIIYEYRISNLQLNSNELPLPKDYSFQLAHLLPKAMLQEFSRCNRKKGQFEKTILPNLSNSDNVKGICILYGNTEIASLGWVYFSLDGCEMVEKYPFTENTFYPMDGFVAISHRGKGLHRLCVQKRFQVAKEAGKDIGYGIVYIENIPAIKDNDRLGKRIGRVYKMKLFNSTVNIYKPSRLYLLTKKHI